MINQEQSLPCPVCSTKIPFDTKQLLLGVQFTCPSCSAAIGLATQSKNVVEETMIKLDKLKSGIDKK